MLHARREAEEIIFPIVDRLLRVKTGVKPEEIDFLVVNCSLFCPTPSLAAMIANRFKMREDIRSYNLGGMGCSASLIGKGHFREISLNPKVKISALDYV